MVRLNPESSGRPLKGSKSPGIGYLYIGVILFLAIAIGTLLSGGFLPVDPNSSLGPPTLPPYYGEDAQDMQKIIFPSTGPDSKKNLQLKTFQVNTCGSTSVINFLIDTSASMQDDNKITKEKDGLRAFIKLLSPSSVIGMQTFSASATERAKIDFYKNNKTQVKANIDSLSAEGWTSMKKGFELAKTKISEAMASNKFSGYKYYMVLLSDGVPEIPKNPGPRTCLEPPGIVPDPLWGSGPGEGRCFAIEQDPRLPVNLATDIKNLGVTIYSIGIFSQTAQSDQAMKPYLEALLKNIASTPSDEHYFATDSNAVNLPEILDNLIETICQAEIGAPPPSGNPGYPFPTYPDNVTHAPFEGPGGEFTTQ